MSETFIGSDLVQFGFAGFAFLLTGVIYYIIKLWHGDMREGKEEMKEVVTKNTEAFVAFKGSTNGLKESVDQNTEVLRRLNGHNK